ncbi:LysR family transcriptional regulator [Tropicibacter sp. R16_0]|uniref:LysR family transcriptional regulator n=1 Tax=Tropicibacter sp. R16_0 TaxID=2821102 RepID=UPI001AD9D50A|nr:LysR family transcriptional regulator [Tropicibacter sp. R16_0]MBO9451174.1 LysR family transcriptional regulator [Tropicibacter sp. R16_0]
MNVNALDLNLLKAFDAMYRERHVGRAGQAIGLAQPSMSNALNRLRGQFDDPLFQRSPEGMQPTAKADELAPRIAEALSIISRMLSPTVFDPQQVRADVVIAATDLTVINLAPKLMTYLGKEAPHVRVSFVPVDKRTVEQKLDEDALTLAIGTFGQLPARFARQKIMRDSFICIARKGLLPKKAPLTMDRFLEAPHALMTLNGGFSGAVDHALKKFGKSRHVVMTGTQFALLPDIVARSDMIATIPLSLSEVAKRSGCKIYVPPLELPEWDVELVLTKKMMVDPLARFIKDAVQGILTNDQTFLAS